jgi:ATP-dependent Clp endopeptidase proteolytic subunit ClpP
MSKYLKISNGWNAETETTPNSIANSTPTLASNDLPEIVERVENDLYFYSEVYRDSVLKLNKELAVLNNDLLYRGIVTKNQTADIFLYIQSYGGSIFSGLSAMDMILKSNVKINTVVDGCAASAATLMSVVGHNRYIKEHSYILIHQLSSMFWGNYEQLKDDMQNNDAFMTMIKQIYKEKTKIPMKKLNEILKHDLWFTPKEALAYGLVDDII